MLWFVVLVVCFLVMLVAVFWEGGLAMWFTIIGFLVMLWGGWRMSEEKRRRP